MKTLYVVRHAKSSWADPSLADFDRPLNKRGDRDAPRMGKFLAVQSAPPDAIISSPAKRAWRTAEIFATAWGIPVTRVVAEERLYGAGVTGVIRIVRAFDDAWKSAMIVGHNPTLTALTNSLTGAGFDNVPTCGVVVISLDGQSWSHIGDVEATVTAFHYPKGLPLSTP